jgi:hypothetical protein
MSAPKILFTILCAVAFSCATAAVGVTQYGSNPYLSYSLFPQDVSRLQTNCLTFFPVYENLPYWGDIDEPEKKPNATYTSTGIDVSTADAGFKHSAQINSQLNSFGYTHKFLNGIVGNLIVDYDIERRTNTAIGTLSDHKTGKYVPFNYSMAHTLNVLKLQGIAGFDLFGMPMGVRLNAGFQNTLMLDKKFSFTKNNVSYDTDRATWGWTTSPCAHIFGATGPEGDAWLQADYAQGPLYAFDLQAGATTSLGKLGGRFAWRTGHQDYYQWVRDTTRSTGDAAIDNNFLGSYEKGQWSRITNNGAGEMYGNFSWIKNDRFSLNIFGLLGYEGAAAGEALSSNRDVAGDAKDKNHTISIEAAPNLSIPLGSEFNYLDLGIHLEYKYGRFDNKYKRWVGGGEIETHRDTRTGADDENSWQEYSFANRNAFDAGIALNSLFPLFSSQATTLSLGILVSFDARFSLMSKYYGTNAIDGSSVNFTVENTRSDYEREYRFGTGVKIQFAQNPFFAWIELTEPMLRSFTPKTTVYDASGKNILYEHEKEPLWMSLEGIRLGLYFSCCWTMPFLNGV